MNRFFIPYPEITENKIVLKENNLIHHIRGVLRLKETEEVVIFDNQGNEYLCSVFSLKEDVILKVKHKLSERPKDNVSLSIACAIPKGSKFDDIVDKLTQIGVDAIIPLTTERVVVKLDTRKESVRLSRWRKIAQSAAQQSQRPDIPVIFEVKTFKELLAESGDFDLKIIPTLLGERKGFKDYLHQNIMNIKPLNILALIGPEGDFSGEEIKSAQDSGFIPVSLGDLVLRVDTAAVVVASLLRYYAYD